MKSARRETLVTGALLVFLVLVTVASGVIKALEQTYPPLSVYSNQPDGARALRLWLEALGYPLEAGLQSEFFVPEGVQAVLLLEPSVLVQEREWEALDRFVEQGGSLVVAGERPGARMALRHYGFSLKLAPPSERLEVVTPLYSSPVLYGEVGVRALSYLSPDGDQPYVVHLASGEHPVVVSLQRGAGRVILASTASMFSNAGLKEPGAGALALNLASGAAGKDSAGRVFFDEWHHGLRTVEDEISGPSQWLFRTPGGQALLLAALIVFAGLVWQGRAFGPAVAPARQALRRAPLEYVIALANLSRRAGHRADVLRQYHTQVKRRLGGRYRLDPDLPDVEWVKRLGDIRPEIPSDELLALLNSLRTPPGSEAELVGRAQKAASWIERYSA